MGKAELVQALRKENVRKMTAQERIDVENKLSEVKAALAGRPDDPNNPSEAPRPDILQNRASMLAEKRKLEDILEKDDDLKAITGNQKNNLLNRAKELRGKVRQFEISERDMKLKPVMQGFERAVANTVISEKKTGKLKLEIKEIMSRIDPENPNAYEEFMSEAHG